MSKPVGVIGAGSFGTTIAKLLSENVDVLLYSRKVELVDTINNTHQHLGVELSPRIKATNRLSEIAESCELIFPVVPSSAFRNMMKNLAIHLRPYHILIHGTKGFDLADKENQDDNLPITRHDVFTMSEVILQESVVVRIGCLSGPNLSKEILAGQPAATLVASPYVEVIEEGRKALKSKFFRIYGSHEMQGAELAGALKNTIAIGAGMLGGLGMGYNVWSLLISRGLIEMIHIANGFGISSRAFLGIAGIGDLVATASSTSSRNYTFGMRKAKGESLEHIRKTMPELAEGVRTLKICKKLCDYHGIRAPITQMLYEMVYGEVTIERGLEFLMSYPYEVDVDFV